jgi:allophanate hydrolase subunit 1
MAKKLKKEELTGLQDAVNKVNQIQLQVGGLELQKHELMHTITGAQAELASVQNNLKEKYGDISVDINTGEIAQNGVDKKD